MTEHKPETNCDNCKHTGYCRFFNGGGTPHLKDCAECKSMPCPISTCCNWRTSSKRSIVFAVFKAVRACKWRREFRVTWDQEGKNAVKIAVLEAQNAVLMKGIRIIARGEANRSRNKSYGGFKPGRLTRVKMMEAATHAIFENHREERKNDQQ
jgi:hypothetical protein